MKRSASPCCLGVKDAGPTLNIQFELCCDNLALCWLLKRAKAWVVSVDGAYFWPILNLGSATPKEWMWYMRYLACLKGACVNSLSYSCCHIGVTAPRLPVPRGPPGGSLLWRCSKRHSIDPGRCEKFSNSQRPIVLFSQRGEEASLGYAGFVGRMLCEYVLDAVLSGHLGARKMYHTVATNVL